MKIIKFAAALLAFSSAAFADSNSHSNNCNGNNSCPTTVNDNDTTSAAATATASPITTNVNTATGGAGGTGGSATAKIEKGAIDIDTANLNNNFNLTHVGVRSENEQSQKQSQTAVASQSQSVDGSGNSSIVWNEKQQPVNSAIAAQAIIAGCGDKALGLAGQGLGFGGSISVPFGSRCADLALVATAVALNKPGLALRSFCRLIEEVSGDPECVNALAVDDVAAVTKN